MGNRPRLKVQEGMGWEMLENLRIDMPEFGDAVVRKAVEWQKEAGGEAKKKLEGTDDGLLLKFVDLCGIEKKSTNENNLYYGPVYAIVPLLRIESIQATIAPFLCITIFMG
jgi:hypothetical protein